MRRYRSVAVAVAFGAVLAGCSRDAAPRTLPSTEDPSTDVTESPSSPAASPTPTPKKPKPTKKPTPSATATPTPTATPPGKILTASGAYLEVSEDENLTTPDPENGCEVHDPDLTQVTCGVENMAGGLLTWVTGYEQHNLPGQSEPRRVIRIYRRLPNGADSMTHVGFGDPGVWADAEARVGSLTGQQRDSLVVIVRFRGTGTMGGYDVLTWRTGTTGPLLRAHHEEGPKAQIYVRSRGYISTYVADYADGAPNCCPNKWQHDNVYWDGTKFRLRQFPKVSSPPSG